MGGWPVAQSPILGTTITTDRLIKSDYESLFSYYEKAYTRPVRAGGVRGAPYRLKPVRQSTRLCVVGLLRMLIFDKYSSFLSVQINKSQKIVRLALRVVDISSLVLVARLVKPFWSFSYIYHYVVGEHFFF